MPAVCGENLIRIAIHGRGYISKQRQWLLLFERDEKNGRDGRDSCVNARIRAPCSPLTAERPYFWSKKLRTRIRRSKKLYAWSAREFLNPDAGSVTWLCYKTRSSRDESAQWQLSVNRLVAIGRRRRCRGGERLR